MFFVFFFTIVQNNWHWQNVNNFKQFLFLVSRLSNRRFSNDTVSLTNQLSRNNRRGNLSSFSRRTILTGTSGLKQCERVVRHWRRRWWPRPINNVLTRPVCTSRSSIPTTQRSDDGVHCVRIFFFFYSYLYYCYNNNCVLAY